MKTFRFLFLAVVLMSFSLPAVHAQKFQVKVVRVADGDTFTGLNRDSLQLKFRISGIDAPEKKQAFGTRSRQALSSMIYGKTITVEVKGADRYGRFLAVPYTADGRDVSLEMISSGMAWHYSYFDDNPVYVRAQEKAKAERKGLWQDSNPVAPWDFRKKK